MTKPELDLKALREKAEAADEFLGYVVDPQTLLALLDRIAELEAERTANHARLAAADKRDAEMVARVEELENGLREVLNAFDERALPPPWKSDSARIAELRKLVESADGRCRLHFLDSDQWARCNQPRLHNGECR